MSGKILSPMIHVLRRQRIFVRLLVMLLLATFLPLVLFSVWSYRSNTRLIREKTYVSYNEMLDQISGEIDQKVRRIRSDTIEISYLSEVQDVLEDFDSKNARELNQAKLDISKAMSRKYAFDNIVSGVLLYSLKGEMLDAYGVNVRNFNLSREYLTEYLEKLHALDGRSIFSAVNKNDEYENAFSGPDCALLAAKAVKHTSTGKIIGYLVLQIDESQLSDIFADAAQSLNSRILILDGEGSVISSSEEDRDLIGEQFSAEGFQTLKEMNVREDDFSPVVLEGHKYEALMRQVDTLNWTVYFLTRDSAVQAQVFTSISQLLKTLFACGLFGTLVTFVFTISIVSPLNQVVEGMEHFEKGNLSWVLDESGNDEITRLSSQFNNMTREITNLMETEKESEKQKRQLEIQTLQAQINPHFLSNTLNTVSCIAQIRKEETIHKLLSAIIELLRDSMKNDDSLHPVKEEIASIQNYVTIQDYRLMGRFTMTTIVEENTEELLMPRFILQPIIENSVIHGIEPLNRRGQIVLRGFLSDDRLIFEVTDNGTGMEPEVAERLLQESENKERSRFSGMGMGNVDKRIKLLCGQEYGLRIQSEKDTYTTVTVTLPVITKTEEI